MFEQSRWGWDPSVLPAKLWNLGMEIKSPSFAPALPIRTAHWVSGVCCSSAVFRTCSRSAFRSKRSRALEVIVQPRSKKTSNAYGVGCGNTERVWLAGPQSSCAGKSFSRFVGFRLGIPFNGHVVRIGDTPLILAILYEGCEQ